MKPRKSNKIKYEKLDNKDRNFVKAFGELHPINDAEKDTNRKVQIVHDDEDEDSQDYYNFKNQSKSSNKDELIEEGIDDVVAPYQLLLNDLITDDQTSSITSKRTKSEKDKKKKKQKLEDTEISHEEKDEEKSQDEDENKEDSDIDGDLDENNVNTYSQEVLCKDNLESEEVMKNDPFHVHFEKNLDEKLIDKIKSNLADRQNLNNLKQNIQWNGLGNMIYSPLSEETKLNLDPNINPKQLYIKQRILERLNDCAEENLGDVDQNEEAASESYIDDFKLDKTQNEILNIMSNYADFYHSDVEVKLDSKVKFVYTLHALNHALKTRSRIIAHNDKIKQNKSTTDVEYRDQGLTRPKVLIIVPYRKFALKIIKIIIRLLMKKNEEFVSNKKRFFDAFGPSGDEDKSEKNKKDEEDEEKKLYHDEDYDFLFSGNTDDHFKIGISVAKKSLKLFTEFYSSDIIIASPLGLKTVIDGDGEAQDHDFLSSIEMLIVDNADVILMQNWEHILTVFDNMHLQPKKSHDTDFSRVRSWLLEGHARLYRQTLIFSRIPAPQINNIFNKYCTNFNGKYQIDLLKSQKYQLGSICKIGFQLAQVFNKIECDSPADLPDARFNFFIDKILPKFRDEMMSHTLIFVPSYFDFVKIRNYFKKNDISSMNVSEYLDKKSIDRARYLFFHGKVHFMLLTERFYFYKRYKIRGINHLVFYDLPNYADYYSNICNFLPDPKRFKNGQLETFSSTVLYSNFDAQKLCAIVGQQRTTHMINSDKSVHMFMTE